MQTKENANSKHLERLKERYNTAVTELQRLRRSRSKAKSMADAERAVIEAQKALERARG